MFSNSEILQAAFCLGLGQAAVMIPAIRRAIGPFAPTALGRVAVGVALGFCAMYGGSKGGPLVAANYLAQYVTALRSGMIVDPSGAVAKASEAAVLDAFVELSVQITESAAETVAAASNEFERVAGLVTNEERRVIYIASDLPRAAARQWTNHNIAATYERVRQNPDGTVVSMWVWFSESPNVAPGMCADIDVGGGFERLVSVTNYYPETEQVNGVPCVRYDFAVPQGARGTVFRPEYEIAFGSAAAPLLVPSGGISVETNGVPVLPFSGTDSYFGSRVQVTYAGGIAVGATIDGGAVTNGVYEL